MFRANPKPSSGEWKVNGQTIVVGDVSPDRKFQSTEIEEEVRGLKIILRLPQHIKMFHKNS